MDLFSDRYGYTQKLIGIQVDIVGEALRNSLWNLLVDFFSDDWDSIVPLIAKEVAKTPVDELPYHDFEKRDWLKSYLWDKDEWWRIYNVLECLIRQGQDVFALMSFVPDTSHVSERVNQILERECSGWRWIENEFVPISSKAELLAVQGATDQARKHGLLGVERHFERALGLLSMKPHGDYRNSVKESISAVESAIHQLRGVEKSTKFQSALNKLADRAGLHKDMKEAFQRLYSYTSDGEGIRHAMLNQDDVGQAEAIYMLVSCSAFVHYLVRKAETIGMLNLK